MLSTMNYMEEDIEEIVDELTNEKFNEFCSIDGCNEAILEAVREKVKDNVEQLIYKDKKHRDEVFLLEAPKLTDIFFSEKFIYEMKAKEEEEQAGKTGANLTTRSTPVTTTASYIHSYDYTLQPSKDALPIIVSAAAAGASAFKYIEPPNLMIASTISEQPFPVQTKLNLFKKDVDIWSRVKGLEIRGKNFKTSNNGSCPRCGHKSNIFVILDFLFPCGDMPEVLQTLLNEGKAVLWSNKQNMNCKDPPTFLCSGNCPFTDIKKCGFNINWKLTDLDKIFFGKTTTAISATDVAPDTTNNIKATSSKNTCAIEEDAFAEKEGAATANSKDAKQNTVLEDHQKDKYYGSSSHSEEDYADSEVEDLDDYEYDEGHVDITHYRKLVSWFVLDEYTEEEKKEKDNLLSGEDEKSIIRTMLALEQARIDFVDGNMKIIQQQQPSTLLNYEIVDSRLMEEDPLRSQLSVTTTTTISNVLPTTTTTQTLLVSSNSTKIEEKSIPSKSDAISMVQDKTTKNVGEDRNDIPMEIDIYDLDDEGKVLPDRSPPATTTEEDGKNAGVSSGRPDKFPVSTNGACPYCRSTDVVYIVLKEKNDDKKLPDLLSRLEKDGYAEVHLKGDHEWPSFQCRSCTYGFNLDWNQTNLQKIFYPTSYNRYNNYYSQYHNRNTATTTNATASAAAADAFIASNSSYSSYYYPSGIENQISHSKTGQYQLPSVWGGMIPPPMPILMPGMIPPPMPMFPFPGMMMIPPPAPPAVAASFGGGVISSISSLVSAPASSMATVAEVGVYSTVACSDATKQHPVTSSTVKNEDLSTTPKTSITQQQQQQQQSEVKQTEQNQPTTTPDGGTKIIEMMEISSDEEGQADEKKSITEVDSQQPKTLITHKQQTENGEDKETTNLVSLMTAPSIEVHRTTPQIVTKENSMSTAKHELDYKTGNDIDAPATKNNKRAPSPEPLALGPDPKRPFVPIAPSANKEDNANGLIQINDTSDELKVEKTSCLVDGDSTLVISSSDEKEDIRGRLDEEKPAASSSERSSIITTKAVIVIEPLDNFEVMLDDPSTTEDFSLGGDVALHLPTTNTSKTGIVQRTDDPASGANSPFTDSLFNIVAKNEETSTKFVENSQRLHSTARLIKEGEKNLTGNSSLAVLTAASSENAVSEEDVVGQSPSKQLGKTVYVQMIDDSSNSNDNGDSVVETTEQQINVTEKTNSTSEPRRSTRYKRLNVSSFF